MRLIVKPLFVFALAVGALSGQEGRGPGVPGTNFIRFSPILMALDTNGDGMISATELKNAPAALRKLDKNGDGQITMDEVRPNFPGRGDGRGPGRGEGREATGPTPEELQQTLMSFDKNKDGKLSKDELPERMRGIFDRGDTNHDGFLTADEIAKVASAQAMPQGGGGREGRGEGRGPGGPRADMVFAALDTDHDGVISADEIKNAAASLKTLDKNGDGQLTEDEVRPEFGGRGRGPGGDGPPRQ
jgi:Ca2+-binding EF-hand superfamily protein